MNETATNYLRYVRASLADAMRLMPDLSDRNVELSFDEIEQGRFGQHATKQLFEIAKKMAGRQLSDELIIPNCYMSSKCLKLLKSGHENASPGNLENPAPDSICA